MIREAFRNYSFENKEFNHRGVESGRLEGLSDGVFALAITLLLISTTPPTTFEQLERFLFELLPFSFCIILIVSIWYQHYIFFLRYGLRDSKVISMNTIFLIIVLFFVYPLKFLTQFTLFPVGFLFGLDWLIEDLRSIWVGVEMGSLMAIYGYGATSVYFTLMLMYMYALRKKDELALTEIELFDTRTSVLTNFLVGIIPFVSATTALFLTDMWAGFISGSIYYLYPIVMPIYGKMVDRRRKVLLERIATAPVAIRENQQK